MIACTTEDIKSDVNFITTDETHTTKQFVAQSLSQADEEPAPSMYKLPNVNVQTPQVFSSEFRLQMITFT